MTDNKRIGTGLDKQQEEYVANLLSSYNISEEEFESQLEEPETRKKKRKKKKKKKNDPPLKTMIAIMLLGVLVAYLFIFMLNQYGNYEGLEAIKTIYENYDIVESSTEATEMLSWVPTYMYYYNNRFIFVLGIFTVTLLLEILVYVMWVLMNRNKNGEEK